MKKAIDNNIRTDFLEQVPLHPYQHTYQIDRSTEISGADESNPRYIVEQGNCSMRLSRRRGRFSQHYIRGCQ